MLDLVLGGYQEERDGDGKLQFAGNMAEVYKELKGKQFSLSEFYGILGEEIAKKVLKWAEERGLVNQKMVDGEEYVEFL
ncbi:ORF C78 [Sulfolobus virus Kamchatka 1]|uniref:ORF C78 n=1 Tax=Sulfolobus virus Kamchatka 1 TaxID=248496 RepID=Q6TDM4_9VIRU|nr:ORF C78 [Sulfolobus virus Kamchatka 1]AAQ94375.1 ORF C78 [Sulfolobus virus Kamchatka 1]